MRLKKVVNYFSLINCLDKVHLHVSSRFFCKLISSLSIKLEFFVIYNF